VALDLAARALAASREMYSPVVSHAYGLPRLSRSRAGPAYPYLTPACS